MIVQIFILLLIPILVFSVHGRMSYEDFSLTAARKSHDRIVAIFAKNIKWFLAFNSATYMVAFSLFEFLDLKQAGIATFIFGLALTLGDFGLVSVSRKAEDHKK